MSEDLSFEKELTKLLSLIRNMTYSFPERHREDLTQEGILGLYAAIETFDSSKNVPFEAYAIVCIKRRIFSYYRRFIKNDNYITDEEVEKSDSGSNFEEDIIDRALTEGLFETLKSKLTELERSVLEVYLEDKSYSEIASALKITEKSVDNTMTRVKNKLRIIFEALK